MLPCTNDLLLSVSLPNQPFGLTSANKGLSCLGVPPYWARHSSKGLGFPERHQAGHSSDNGFTTLHTNEARVALAGTALATSNTSQTIHFQE
jgi:hypothetical protein